MLQAARDEAGAPGGGGRARSEPTVARRQRAAFIRDWNLWVRDVATGKETQLTTDGVKDFGYATDNAGWTQQRSRRSCVWSPDSKKIATFQQDQRDVGEMYLVNTKVGHPDAAGLEVSAARRPDVVTMIQRVVIDVDAAKVVALEDGARPASLDALRRHRVPRRRVGRRPVEPRRDRSVAFVSTSRDHKHDAAARRRRGDRRGARRARRDGRDVLRVGQRPRELALPAGVERGDLVLRARQLGPAVSLRSADRQAEEPDHDRRRQRHAAAPRRREDAACSTSSAVGREKGRDPYFRTSTASAWTARTWRC